MRVILDTNMLVSALISPSGTRQRYTKIYEAWKLSRSSLVTCQEQLDEFVEVTRQPTLKKLITAAEAGRMMNQIKVLAIFVTDFPRVEVARDPADNFLFAMAEASSADYLVTGDKSGVLG